MYPPAQLQQNIAFLRHLLPMYSYLILGNDVADVGHVDDVVEVVGEGLYLADGVVRYVAVGAPDKQVSLQIFIGWAPCTWQSRASSAG